MTRRALLVTTLSATALALLAALPAHAASNEIRIAHIYSKTGPLEAYGKQTAIGFQMGLDYATGGTMMVAGKKLVVIEKDDQGKPDVGKSLLAAAYADDKVDIAVGPTASPVALAMLPVAEEYKKILLVEPAVADSITGEKWNKYIFRTGRNSARTPSATPPRWTSRASIATLAQDCLRPRRRKAFKERSRPSRARGVPAAARRLHRRRSA
jgi:branched-chain amino acid transport system substrate-binding protein